MFLTIFAAAASLFASNQAVPDRSYSSAVRSVFVVERDLVGDGPGLVDSAAVDVAADADCRRNCVRTVLKVRAEDGVTVFERKGDETVRYSILLGADAATTGHVLVDAPDAGAADGRTAATSVALNPDGSRSWAVRTVRRADGSTVRRIAVAWAV